MPTKTEKFIEVDWSKLKVFNKRLRVKFVKQWMEVALEAYVLTLEKMIVNEIDRQDLNISGEMKKSVTHQVTKKVRAWLVEVGTNVVTGTGYPYPVGVHEGTIAHVAPFDKIETWARLKTGLEGKELKRMAGAVWTKIKIHGTEAHPFMQKVFTQSETEIRTEISKELSIAIGRGIVK